MFKSNPCHSIRPLATLAYTTDMFNNSSIVSSIEFDKDQEFFAIAGVTKRIKIYDYNVVLKDMVDIHYPSTEMVCSSKISCISWSSFHKSTLASSDYEGTVIVWDSATNTKSTVWQEHEKRCWSVDFNLVDTKLIASGSDDARVKLWSTNMSHSVASLEAKANVCCVKFNPRWVFCRRTTSHLPISARVTTWRLEVLTTASTTTTSGQPSSHSMSSRYFP